MAALLLCASSPASPSLAAAARGPAPTGTLLLLASLQSCSARLMPVGAVATVGGGVREREMCLTV